MLVRAWDDLQPTSGRLTRSLRLTFSRFAGVVLFAFECKLPGVFVDKQKKTAAYFNAFLFVPYF